MRYSTLYIETSKRWAVVDALSCDFALKLFNSEKSAHYFAQKEESRWNKLIKSNLSIQVY
tara:strand:- start:224 stop:403 length:180 start_codon:yes stop_codon:yes gene_type:complete